MDDLKLYVLDRCPYCNNVRRVLGEKGLEVEIKDVSIPENQDELMELGGKDQVPMLLINGIPMYESEEIIKWIEKQD